MSASSASCSAAPPTSRRRTDIPAEPIDERELGTARWKEAGLPPRPCVVFDLDGVLSDAAGRQHFLNNPSGRKDWTAFFAACADDPLVHEVHVLLDLLDPELMVVLLTARPARVFDETLAWLARYEVRWDLLVMRPERDGRSARDFKRDVVRQLRSAGYELRLAFEDDRRNVSMLHDEGVPCVYLHSGYYG